MLVTYIFTLFLEPDSFYIIFYTSSCIQKCSLKVILPVFKNVLLKRSIFFKLNLPGLDLVYFNKSFRLLDSLPLNDTSALKKSLL